MFFSRLKTNVSCDCIFKCDNEETIPPLENYFTKFETIQDQNEEITLYRQKFQKNIFIEDFPLINRYICRDWMFLQNAIINDTPISLSELLRIREGINRCFILLIQNLNAIKNKRYTETVINQLKRLLGITLPISDLDFAAILKLSQNGNEDSPIFQYFHLYLDLQYFILILYEILDRKDDLNRHLSIVIKDLIDLSEKIYVENKTETFICDCLKNFWLFLQFQIENIFGEDSFWPMFNNLIENHTPGLVLTLLKDVAKLQRLGIDGKDNFRQKNRVKPNFPILESNLKELLIKAEFNTLIYDELKSLQPLLIDLWLENGRIEIFQLLWDFFSKRLNISNRPNANLSTKELVGIIKFRDVSEDPFELFALMLQEHLGRHPQHWGKMKGRIYSQLGPNKVKDLTEIGILHVLLLFTTLSKVNPEELCRKYLNFINALPLERKLTNLIISFASAFVITLVEKGESIENLAHLHINILAEALNQQKSSLIKIFIHDFHTIIESSSNLNLHQWLLIDSWVVKYLPTCYQSDLVTTLDIFIKIIDKINAEKMWTEWEQSFKSLLYPALKTVSSSLTAPQQAGYLCGQIVVNSPSLLFEAFAFFNDSIIVAKVSASFLAVVLDTSHNIILTPQQENVALQTWLKTCLLTTAKKDICDLTRKIARFDLIPAVMQKQLKTAEDPLQCFINTLSNNLEDSLQSLTLNKLCETCFGGVDKCIRQYFTQPDNEGVVIRVFTYLALACYEIGPLLYDKHKTNCPYTRLISVVLLPSDILLGKPIHPFILQGVKKTWHLFFYATMKLSTSNDAYIEKTLRDMIVKYIPHFPIADSPMHRCLNNETMAEVLLDKLSKTCFNKSTTENESNVAKSLKLIQNFVETTTSPNAFKVVTKKVLSGLLELIMFNTNCRNLALGIIKTMTGSGRFLNVRNDFEEVLIGTTDTFLAFYTNEYFQMMNVLSKVVNIRNVIPKIKLKVSDVERMRGVGFDRNLRMHLEKLEGLLK